MGMREKWKCEILNRSMETEKKEGSGRACWEGSFYGKQKTSV
jgi:hypothetical protein